VMDDRTDLQPWERHRDESSKAYRAFLTYRDLVGDRSLIAAAQALAKNYALIRRWAKRHRWAERVWAWDLHRVREEEAALRAQREEMLQRQLKDADRLQKLAMARLSSLVMRDPETGELALSREVSVADAARLYKLALDIERNLPDPPQTEEPEEAELAPFQLRSLSTQELQQMLTLARERANDTAQEGSHHDDDSHDA
jgi:hypothetical protein